MSFTSGIFFIFLIAVFAGYWLVAGWPRARALALIAASGFFYAQTGVWPLILLLSLSLSDFMLTRLMPVARDQQTRRMLLMLALAKDIGALCVFKYANFLLDTAGSVTRIYGLEWQTPHLSLLAPLGISFFVFQSLACVIDVYRGDQEPVDSWIDYLAFTLFFPTIVAGPILRAKQFLPQLRARLTLDAQAGGVALFLIALGLLKKIAVADYLASNFVDRVFDFPERFSALENWMAFYGYALQIYCDFSGYSDLAIGVAMLLGIALPANFDTPYRARSLPEFWRRWHISLSTWLRDYVFAGFASRGRR
ncbi:MAG: MBOAT family O-acyltransferase, partial [Blastocatellia bacterium]